MLERRSSHHFISERHAALAHELEAVLQTMEKDGSLKIIQQTAERQYQQQCG